MDAIPNINHLHFLRSHTFLRNFPIDSFCSDFNYQIPINNFICYNVGLINGNKYVQSFQILSMFTTGINSYFIRWWNTAFYEDDPDCLSSSCEFWIHSGISLRKNFFLFEDRFSLFRSSFLYDPKQGLFFRLFSIEKFFQSNEKIPNSKIFSSPCKYFMYKKRPLRGKSKRNLPKKELGKYLNLILKDCNYQNSLEKTYPALFLEIGKVLIDQNGNSS